MGGMYSMQYQNATNVCVCEWGGGEGTCVLREVQDSTPVECNRALHALT